MADQRVRLDRDAVQWRAMDDELLMLDMRGSRYLRANRTAAVLWPLLVAGASVQQLAEQLVADTGIELARACADVEGLVGWLRDEGLLTGA